MTIVVVAEAIAIIFLLFIIRTGKTENEKLKKQIRNQENKLYAEQLARMQIEEHNSAKAKKDE